MEANCSLDDGQTRAVSAIIMATSGFSVVCSLIVLLVMVLFKKYRVATQRLILYLIVAVLLKQTMLLIMGATTVKFHNNVHYCTITAFFYQQFSWYVMMAVFCLTYDMFAKAVFQRIQTEQHENRYVVTIFLIPFVFNWIPYINDAYGFNGAAICWIKEKNNNCTIFPFGLTLQFLLFWVPFLLGMFCVLAASIFALVVTRRRRYAYSGTMDPSDIYFRRQLEKDVRYYQLYPVVYILINIISPVRLIITAIQRPIFIVYIIHHSVSGLEGAVICLGFLLSYLLRKELWWRGNLQSVFYSSKGRAETYHVTQDCATDSLTRNSYNINKPNDL